MSMVTVIQTKTLRTTAVNGCLIHAWVSISTQMHTEHNRAYWARSNDTITLTSSSTSSGHHHHDYQHMATYRNLGLPVQHRLAGEAYIFCCWAFFATGTYRWESARQPPANPTKRDSPLAMLIRYLQTFDPSCPPHFTAATAPTCGITLVVLYSTWPAGMEDI